MPRVLKKVFLIPFLIWISIACSDKSYPKKIKLPDEHHQKALSLMLNEPNPTLKTQGLVLIARNLLRCNDTSAAQDVMTMALKTCMEIPDNKQQYALIMCLPVVLALGDINQAKGIIGRIRHPNLKSTAARYFASYFAKHHRPQVAERWLSKIHNNENLIKAWAVSLTEELYIDSLQEVITKIWAIKEKDIQPTMFYHVANAYLKKGLFTNAKEAALELYRYQKLNGDRYRYLEVHIYAKLFRAQKKLGMLKPAEENLKLAAAIAKKLRYNEHRSQALMMVADVYFGNNDSDNAMIYLKLARESVKFEPNVSGKLKVYAKLYDRYKQLSQVPSTGHYHEEAYWAMYLMRRAILREYYKSRKLISIYPPIKNFDATGEYKAILMTILAQRLAREGQLDAALMVLKELPETRQPKAYATIALDVIDRNQHAKAMQLLEKSEKLGLWILSGNALEKSETQLRIIEGYLKLNNPEKALALINHIPIMFYKAKAYCEIAWYSYRVSH